MMSHIVNEITLRAVNKYFNEANIKFLNGDFEKTVKNAKKDDFVYFDPPYAPISKTSNFTGYNESGFGENEALFVSLIKPYNRLGISGIEIVIRNLGKQVNINKVHPHKFRRTMAIDKGMPIERVQKLLGYIKIDTTMEYAMVNQINVKNFTYKIYYLKFNEIL